MKTQNAARRLPALLIITCLSLITSCIVPAGFPMLDRLTAEPRYTLYPLGYSFVPGKELIVTAHYRSPTGGEESNVPLATAGLVFDTYFGVTGPRTGTVEYEGKTAQFEVYIYDPDDDGEIPSGTHPSTPVIVSPN